MISFRCSKSLCNIDKKILTQSNHTNLIKSIGKKKEPYPSKSIKLIPDYAHDESFILILSQKEKKK
jgi:hypothetical protein